MSRTIILGHLWTATSICSSQSTSSCWKSSTFIIFTQLPTKAKSMPKYAAACMAFHNLAYLLKSISSASSPGLWCHQWFPISFCLIVNDFGIKYIGQEHANHLIQCLCNNYQGVDIAANASAASTSNGTIPIISVTSACLATSKMPITNSSIPLPKRPKTTHIPPQPNNMA